MGVTEDAESRLQEEDLLFEGDAGQAAMPAKVNKYFCRAAALLGLISAAVLAFGSGSQHGSASIKEDVPLVCGPTGTCRLWGLFFDPEVHQVAAESLVRAAAPTLSTADLPMVRGLVEGSFRNISIALSENAPKVAKELHLLKINATIKQYVAEAMDLVADPRVQSFGRQVAAAVRASTLVYKDEEDLKRHIAKNLWHQLDEIQQFQLEEVSWRIHAIWSLGKGSQWEMTLDVEAMNWMEADDSTDPGEQPMTAANIGAGLTAVAGGALAEGRTLLDLMLMCIRSKGSSWSTDLHGSVEAFAGPLAAPCEPELAVGESVELGRSLICPLKFGMLGVDALRYASTLTRKPEEAGCLRPGQCPLRGLFFDSDVHKMVAKSLIGLGVPLLGPAEMSEVSGLVGSSFRSISSTLQKRAPQLGDALNHFSMNSTLRDAVLEAMKLTHDPQVQSLGRHVARVLAAGQPYKTAEALRETLAADLEQRLSSVQKLQERVIPQTLSNIWGWGKDQQWELALAVERAEASGAGIRGPALRGVSELDAAIACGALEEGRALLDVMLMCIHSKGLSWHASLGGAETAFVGPLATRCEPDSLTAATPNVRSTVICPLKFGLLGLDALRYTQLRSVLPQPAQPQALAAPGAARGRLEHRPCTALQACPLRDIFFDRSVQERAVADIIGAAADPSMLLGRSELPLVRQAVVSAFRNISDSVHESVPSVDAELGQIAVNHTVKMYVFEALQLMTDLHVQEIGRHIARALRADGSFANPKELKLEVVRNLWRSFPEIQRLQATVDRYPVRSTWHAASAPQLELTFELEAQERRHAKLPIAASPLLRQEEAVAQAAWQEGRALLDLALAFVHSGLGGAVGVLSPPPHVHCDPDVKVGREAGFQSALVCPLRFGVMGMDVLRFTDSIFTWTHVDKRSCQDRGMCPLARFFFDNYVHAAATADILRIAAAAVDSKRVESVVETAFRNVSVHVHLYAGGLAEHLAAAQVGDAEKEQFAAAMQLVGNPSVQAFGREIATAVRAASGFASRAELEAQVVSFLGARTVEAMRNYTLANVDDGVLKIWRMGEDKQWYMTTDAETVNALKMDPPPIEQPVQSTLTPVPVVETPAQQATALMGAALVEGRVLLDLMLMHVRGLHPHLEVSLFGAMDVFSAPLAVVCPLELPAEGANLSLSDSLLCPLKFGMLGLDALRYAVSARTVAEPAGSVAAAR